MNLERQWCPKIFKNGVFSFYHNITTNRLSRVELEFGLCKFLTRILHSLIFISGSGSNIPPNPTRLDPFRTLIRIYFGMTVIKLDNYLHRFCFNNLMLTCFDTIYIRKVLSLFFLLVIQTYNIFLIFLQNAKYN